MSLRRSGVEVADHGEQHSRLAGVGPAHLLGIASALTENAGLSGLFERLSAATAAAALAALGILHILGPESP